MNVNPNKPPRTEGGKAMLCEICTFVIGAGFNKLCGRFGSVLLTSLNRFIYDRTGKYILNLLTVHERTHNIQLIYCQFMTDHKTHS